MLMIKSIENNFDHPKVNHLLIKHFIELRSVSSKGSTHVLDIPGLKDPSINCLLYTSPSPRDQRGSRMPSSA